MIDVRMMNPWEEGALHCHYEKQGGEVCEWYLAGMILWCAGMSERDFLQYANRWDVTPTAVCRDALMFGYYHANNLRLC